MNPIDEINLDQCQTYDLLKLIRDVMECIETELGKDTTRAHVTILSDEVMTVEIDDKRFRIEVKDLTRFQ